MISEIANKYPSIKVLKKYPESGQKHVFLVNIEGYGTLQNLICLDKGNKTPRLVCHFPLSVFLIML